MLHQFRPLLGEKGLLPVPNFVRRVSFAQSPSIFFWWPKDAAFVLFGLIGLVLSMMTVTGVSERFGLGVSVGVWGVLWLLYLSYVNVGQTWYSFGWETLLLEAGFLAMFLGDAKTAPSVVVIWLFRWLAFRVMLGAGLIKLRGDECWRDLTCLVYHYETQPMPNPLSWLFHQMPLWMHKAGVLFNHFAELVAPWGLMVPGVISAVAGVATIGLMGVIGLSGNLAFLNVLTGILAISAFSDKWIMKVLPLTVPILPAIGAMHQGVLISLAMVVGMLSLGPVLNMISPNQRMNTSFNPLHLVNSYGAFGSITRPRYEVIVEGSSDGQEWKEYEIWGKPGKLNEMPPQVAPYHLRLGWLFWFAGFTPHQYYPWFTNFMAKLLDGDRQVLSLVKYNPFESNPPRFVRAGLYEYHFTSWEERQSTGNWWKREYTREYYPTVSLDQAEFVKVLRANGWR